MMLASDIFRIVFGLVAVIGMIGAAAYAARKAGLASLPGAAGRMRRLAVREMLPLDARRRLAVIACDGKEYLIILGATGETLIDANLAPVEQADMPELANPFAGLSDFARRLRRPAAESKDAA
ncbi:MAG: flagellar biosynthetic protein FliO [Parvularculaceae bacterium]